MKGRGRGGEDWTDLPQREASDGDVKSEFLVAVPRRRVFFCPEQDGSKVLRNIDKYLPDYT
jgi:hypothetical protein